LKRCSKAIGQAAVLEEGRALIEAQAAYPALEAAMRLRLLAEIARRLNTEALLRLAAGGRQVLSLGVGLGLMSAMG
jgi:hypothetical protein